MPDTEPTIHDAADDGVAVASTIEVFRCGCCGLPSIVFRDEKGAPVAWARFPTAEVGMEFMHQFADALDVRRQ